MHQANAWPTAMLKRSIVSRKYLEHGSESLSSGVRRPLKKAAHRCAARRLILVLAPMGWRRDQKPSLPYRCS